MDDGSSLLHPHRMERMLTCCPTCISTYAVMNLDTVPKIINHMLVLMMMSDAFLFLSSWSVSFLQTTGFNTVFVSFLLCVQTIVVWLIINNNRFSALSFLAPTDYMIGIALGITVGASILSFVITTSFRYVEQCKQFDKGQETWATTTTTTYPSPSSSSATNFEHAFLEQLCGKHRRSFNRIWFWSGLLFWLNFAASLLIAVGRHQLSQDDRYHKLGGGFSSIGEVVGAGGPGDGGPTLDDYEGHFSNQRRQHQGSEGTFPGGVPSPSFMGDYSDVPAIRNSADNSSGGAHISSV